MVACPGASPVFRPDGRMGWSIHIIRGSMSTLERRDEYYRNLYEGILAHVYLTVTLFQTDVDAFLELFYNEANAFSTLFVERSRRKDRRMVRWTT